MRRYTASREKDDTEAMFPVEKKADCRKKRKKRARRRSGRATLRKVCSGWRFSEVCDFEVMVIPFVAGGDSDAGEVV